MVIIMNMSDNDNVLSKLKNDQNSFGQSLRFIRQQQGITIREIAKKVNRTPTYISDIERGNNKPPEKELMQKIMSILELQENELQDYLYDLAAQERGGVSEDIAAYIMDNDDLRQAIRMTQRHKISEQFWRDCVKHIR